MKKSIFAKIFSVQIFTSVAILLAMSFISTFAVRRSISDWNKGKQADLESIMLPAILKVYRLDGNFSASTIKNAISLYLTDSLYVFIFNKEKKPVLLINKGNELSKEAFEKQFGSVQNFLAKNPPLEIKDGEQSIGFIAVSNVDFFEYAANRQFVSTIIRVVSIGVFVTTILSLVISLVISSSFSKEANLLVKGLNKLSKGERTVSFPELKTTELDIISTSANILQIKLEKEERLRRQWMEDVSHDLRTPVTAIKAQFEGMIDDVLTIDKNRIKNLLLEFNRVESLIKNLQELSRYESPEMKIHLTKINTTSLSEDIKEWFSFLCNTKNIQFISESEDFLFCADEQLVQRCISNILQNAFQNTTEGGKIKVNIFKDKDTAKIQIENTGNIPQEAIPHLFDRLYRFNKGRSDSGSGLGLSIVKAIMTLHNGNVIAENVDNFARFTLQFS